MVYLDGLVPLADDFVVGCSLVQVVNDSLLQLTPVLFLSHGLKVSYPRHLINLFLPLLALLATHLVELLLGQLSLFVQAI